VKAAAVVILAALLCAHLAVALAAVAAVVTVALAVLGFGIAVLVAESGWRVRPCRRRFAW
jgi:hypothetical protein